MLPLQAYAGDTITFDITQLDTNGQYSPLNGWTAIVIFYNSKDTYHFSASIIEDVYYFTALTNSSWVAGKYQVVLRFAKGTEVNTVFLGEINILPDPYANPVDDRSHIKKVLDAIEAVIEGRASRSEKEYSLGDKKLVSMTHEELFKQWNRYKFLYKQELQAKGLEPVSNQVKVRFVSDVNNWFNFRGFN
jgi:hypothetical protein